MAASWGVGLPLYIESAVEEACKHIFIKEDRKVKFYTTEIKEDLENLGAAANAIQNFLEEYAARD